MKTNGNDLRKKTTTIKNEKKTNKMKNQTEKKNKKNKKRNAVGDLNETFGWQFGTTTEYNLDTLRRTCICKC